MPEQTPALRYTFSRGQMKKWGYFNGDTTCAFGLDEENTVHMLRCSLLTPPCTLDNILKFNDIGYKCTDNGSGKFDDTMMMMIEYYHKRCVL